MDVLLIVPLRYMLLPRATRRLLLEFVPVPNNWQDALMAGSPSLTDTRVSLAHLLEENEARALQGVQAGDTRAVEAGLQNYW